MFSIFQVLKNGKHLSIPRQPTTGALVKDEDKVQHSIYFINKALKGAKERYPRHVSPEVTIVLPVS